MSSRVAVLSFDDLPPIGGQGRYVGALESELSQRGFEMSFLSSQRSPWGKPSIPRRSRRAPLDFSWWLRSHLSAAATELSPDLWHAQGGPGGVLMLKRPPGAPLIYTAHHTYRTAHGWGLATMLMGGLESRGYKMASQVIAVSPSTASSVAGDSGVDPRKITVIPPGVDIDWFRPLAEPGPERPTILFVGRLVPIKGVQHFVAAYRALKPDFPDLDAEVCGEGVLAGPVESVAERMPGRLRLLGKVTDLELRSAYQRAKLLVMPSKYEGLGIVALEAMACGTPVVAMEVAGLRDLVGPGVVLVDPNRQAALPETIASLLRDPDRLESLSAQARARVEADYSWQVVGDRIAEVYRDNCRS